MMVKMKRLLSLLLVFALMEVSLFVFASCSSAPKNISSKYEVTSEKTSYVLMTVKDYGGILIELDAETAPITVANFQKLVSEKFYDGLTFHRVVKGFMIQGGDPKGNGTGGSSETIKGEFAANGVENNLSHIRGVISMARSEDPDSASSQFFIVHQDNQASLDGKYAAFGKVIDGMDTVDAIADCKVTLNSRWEKSSPVEKVVIESAVFVNLKQE